MNTNKHEIPNVAGYKKVKNLVDVGLNGSVHLCKNFPMVIPPEPSSKGWPEVGAELTVAFWTFFQVYHGSRKEGKTQGKYNFSLYKRMKSCLKLIEIHLQIWVLITVKKVVLSSRVH